MARIPVQGPRFSTGAVTGLWSWSSDAVVSKSSGEGQTDNKVNKAISAIKDVDEVAGETFLVVQ